MSSRLSRTLQRNGRYGTLSVTGTQSNALGGPANRSEAGSRAGYSPATRRADRERAARVAVWRDQSSAYSTIDAAEAAACQASNVAATVATTTSRLTVRMLGLP